MSSRVASLLALSLFLAASVRAQQVLTVDAAGGGAMFTELQAAVDAATSGDTLLVRPGTYARTTVDGKGLALVGDGPGVIVNGITVSNTQAGDAVLIHRIEAAQSVIVRDCVGDVWIEDCDFDFRLAFLGNIQIRDCAAVQLHRVNVDGAGVISQDGILVERSAVHVFGGSVSPVSAGSGSSLSGVLAIDSFVYLQGTFVRGGAGSVGFRSCGEDGGAGLTASGNSSVIALGAQFVGGPPGANLPLFCSNPTATAGPPTSIVSPATLTSLPGAPLEMASRGVAREGQPVDYVVDGESGDALVLAFALNADALFFPLLNGTLASGANFTGIPVGTVGASGALTVATNAPTLPNGVDVIRFYVQALALRADASLIAGSAQAVTMLDASF